jgi:hypothetical protein
LERTCLLTDKSHCRTACWNNQGQWWKVQLHRKIISTFLRWPLNNKGNVRVKAHSAPRPPKPLCQTSCCITIVSLDLIWWCAVMPSFLLLLMMGKLFEIKSNFSLNKCRYFNLSVWFTLWQTSQKMTPSFWDYWIQQLPIKITIYVFDKVKSTK